jgi:hypothetical protein
MFEDYDIFNRQRVTIHCVITLLSPLSHIGEVTGNVSNLKTVKRLDLEGQPRQVFAYSGNAIRNGILRRRGTASALEALGLHVNPDVHHTLFAGGRIDGSTGNDMELDKRIRQLMPWLSVLGTAKPAKVFGVKDAQMVQGRLNVGSAYLACYESAPYLFEQFPGVLPPEASIGLAAITAAKSELGSDPFTPPNQEAIARYSAVKNQHLPLLRKQLRSWTEYLTVDQTTRRDSTQDPTLQKFLPPDKPLLAGTGGEDKKKSDQMISSDRLIMAGAKLYSRWDACVTAVEEGWIYDALLAFDQFPYIGGKGQRGNGQVSLDLWYQSGKERGKLVSLGGGVQALESRFTEQYSRYQEYISTYRGYLEEAKTSQEIGGLLNATA